MAIVIARFRPGNTWGSGAVSAGKEAARGLERPRGRTPSDQGNAGIAPDPGRMLRGGRGAPGNSCAKSPSVIRMVEFCLGQDKRHSSTVARPAVDLNGPPGQSQGLANLVSPDSHALCTFCAIEWSK